MNTDKKTKQSNTLSKLIGRTQHTDNDDDNDDGDADDDGDNDNDGKGNIDTYIKANMTRVS